ncbi:hypothetical protein [Nocardia cyriacigeorgica]|uniref:hypothetical protein n=1 Tax=Nocardia cyriacigeorgica TaxID=135487 RepID=UPI0028113112|nr:hypothetical protein [Nocardia cyriacigeorgica]
MSIETAGAAQLACGGHFLSHHITGQQDRTRPFGKGLGHRRLAGARKSTDQRQPDGSAIGMGAGYRHMAASPFAGGAFTLGEPDDIDLRADEGAIGDVVVEQRPRRSVRRSVKVVGQQPFAEVRVSEELEIHSQEGDIVDTVDVSELVVEVQAVEDPEAIRQGEDILGEEISVAVDDAALSDAAVE